VLVHWIFSVLFFLKELHLIRAKNTILDSERSKKYIVFNMMRVRLFLLQWNHDNLYKNVQIFTLIPIFWWFL